MSKGKMIGLGVAVLAAMVAAGAVSWANMAESKRAEVSKWLRTHVLPPTSDGGESEADAIARAEKNVRLLFSSAQNTFIHRNGKRMAASIDELGAGFRVGEHGAVIYEDIWEARLRAGEKAVDEIGRKVLARPYRYAVLRVSGLATEKDDARTTCVVAVPVRGDLPVLVMEAGPVVNDPQDFLKAWPIRRVTAPEAKRRISEAARGGRAFDAALRNLCK